ncbi:hypothetical protein [Mycoplasma sp. P36-A1]|uniref:hypothetical protein n=1 Tax=Mycoplasma sp. P36-A1 TaxID=3252900 RepID=UPI003C303F46
MKKKILFLIILLQIFLIIILLRVRQVNNDDVFTADTTLLDNLTKAKYVKEQKNDIKNYKEYYIDNNDFKVIKVNNKCTFADQLRNRGTDLSNYYYIYEESVTIYYLENNKCKKIVELPSINAISINVINFENKVLINLMSSETNKSGIYLVSKDGAKLISECNYFAKFIVNDVDKTIIALEPNEDEMHIKEYSYDGKKINEESQNYNSKYYDNIFVLDNNTIGLIEFKYEAPESDKFDMVIEKYQKDKFFSALKNGNKIETKRIEKYNRSITNIQVLDGLIRFSGSSLDDDGYNTLICSTDFVKCHNYEYAILLNNKYIFISDHKNMSINLSRFGEKTYEKILSYSESFEIKSSDNNGVNLLVYNDKQQNFEIRYDYLVN